MGLQKCMYVYAVGDEKRGLESLTLLFQPAFVDQLIHKLLGSFQTHGSSNSHVGQHPVLEFDQVLFGESKLWHASDSKFVIGAEPVFTKYARIVLYAELNQANSIR